MRVHPDTVLVKFEGQGHKSKFKVTGVKQVRLSKY